MGQDSMAEVMRRTVRELAGAARPEEGMRFEVPSGTSIREGRDALGRTSVSVRAPDGALLMEFRPGDGRCRVFAEQIEVEASDTLRLKGRAVEIEGERVSLRAQDAALELERGALGIAAERVDVQSVEGRWTTRSLRIAAQYVETKAQRLVQRADEMETAARLLIERTRESYREVEELAQTKAGRIRMVAEDTFRVLGRRTLFKAREDMSLRGERIYLD